MRRVRIYVLFCGGIFRDVFASYSEASLHWHTPTAENGYGKCCEIKTFDRDEY